MTVQPYIVDKKCPAQKDLCKVIAACPDGAVSYIEDDQAALGGRIFFDLGRCGGCGQCVAACCGAAIEMR